MDIKFFTHKNQDQPKETEEITKYLHYQLEKLEKEEKEEKIIDWSNKLVSILSLAFIISMIAIVAYYSIKK